MCRRALGMPTPQSILMQGVKTKAAKLDAKGTAYDFKAMLRMERDSGVTNIRNVGSQHWKRWLGVEHRCVVPFTSFSEFNKAEGGDVWLAVSEDRPSLHLPGYGPTGPLFAK